MQEKLEEKVNEKDNKVENKKNALFFRLTDPSSDEDDSEEKENSLCHEEISRVKEVEDNFQEEKIVVFDHEVKENDSIQGEPLESEKEKVCRKNKTQRWSINENKSYIKFLQEHAHLFKYKSVRRLRQIFILFSEKMGGKRTPSQCKSHHQKMKNATEKGTIKEIIYYIKGKNLSRECKKELGARKAQLKNKKDSFVENKKFYKIKIPLMLDHILVW